MSSRKRKDSKGRGLRAGEYQRKDGRYEYRFIDKNGANKCVYSWKLEPFDRLPPDKKEELSLREKEKEIARDLEDDVEVFGGNYTVNTLVEKYLYLRRDLKPTTKENYKNVGILLSKMPFGRKRIDTIKIMDAKILFVDLSEKGISFNYLSMIKNVLTPAFQMADDDDLIRKNPFNFKLSSVIKDDSIPRQALTEREEQSFLEFVKNDVYYEKYYEAFYILLHTGLRISEFSGLTISDINFENRTISVNKQLIEYNIQTTKSKSSDRVIPMTNGVYVALKNLIKKRRVNKIEPMIDGKVGFLYVTKNSKPLVANSWQNIFRSVCKKYNTLHLTPIHVTPHICRHTYCTNMVKAGANPKILQYLMGHSSIRITLDRYTHLGLEDAILEIDRLEKEGSRI